MKYLVTGANGFIGTHLVNRLLDDGHRVHGLDVLPCKVSRFMRYPAYSESPVDVLSHGVFETEVERYQPDRVVHLAAQVGRLKGEDDIKYTIDSNAALTTLVARVCAKHAVPITYTSTSEIYGDHGENTCYEDTEWLLPHNLYGLSKRWGEEALRLYQPFGLQIIRLSMPYGPGAPPGRGRRAMDNFLWHAHHGREITVHEGAERAWCYIDDTINGFIKILNNRDMSIPDVFNLGRDDNAESLLNTAIRACNIAGASTDLIKVVEPPSAQTVVKRLGTNKLRELGWSPQTELEEGMLRLDDWIKHFDADGNYSSQIGETQ